MLYEVWELYHYGSKKSRFVELRYTEGEQKLVRGGLPRSHGMSYLYCRQYFKSLGDVMGLDLLLEHPEKSYSELVELTKNEED